DEPRSQCASSAGRARSIGSGAPAKRGRLRLLRLPCLALRARQREPSAFFSGGFRLERRLGQAQRELARFLDETPSVAGRGAQARAQRGLRKALEVTEVVRASGAQTT